MYLAHGNQNFSFHFTYHFLRCGALRGLDCMMLLGAEREIENTCAGRLRLAIMIENRLACASALGTSWTLGGGCNLGATD